jgi:hypothetical protein
VDCYRCVPPRVWPFHEPAARRRRNSQPGRLRYISQVHGSNVRPMLEVETPHELTKNFNAPFLVTGWPGVRQECLPFDPRIMETGRMPCPTVHGEGNPLSCIWTLHMCGAIQFDFEFRTLHRREDLRRAMQRLKSARTTEAGLIGLVGPVGREGPTIGGGVGFIVEISC